MSPGERGDRSSVRVPEGSRGDCLSQLAEEIDRARPLLVGRSRLPPEILHELGEDGVLVEPKGLSESERRPVRTRERDVSAALRSISRPRRL